MNFEAMLTLAIALVVFVGVAVLLPQETNGAKSSETVTDSSERLAFNIPHTKRTTPIPGVEIFPMPPAGRRTDTRTAMTQNGDIYVGGGGYLWKSTDRGQTWDIQKLPQATGGGFGIINDDVFVLVFDVPGSGSSVIRSTDYGRTWSEPFALDISPYDFSGGGWADVYQHPDGTAMMTVTLRHSGQWSDWSKPEVRGIRDHIFRSTDRGKTWGDRTLLTVHSAESSILALSDSNKMLAYIRAQRGYLPEDPPGIQKWTGVPEGNPYPLKNGVIAESEDNGRTWKNLRLFDTYGSVPGEIVQTPDGLVAAVWLQRYPHEKAEIRVRISADEGRTWSRKTYSLMKGTGYPSSVVYPDGTIITVCENSKMNAAGQPRGGRSMAAARWRLPSMRKHK